MRPPRPPANEEARVAALRAYGVLDSAKDQAFDALVRVASSVCEAPIALVTLIDEKRQWVLANHGLPGASETARELSFCAHVVETSELTVVEDAADDERFADNPFVVDEPHIRFYAGCPLIDQAGFALGTLCVLDRTPRTLSDYQRTVLRELATAMVRLLEAKKIDNALFAAEMATKRARADLSLVLDAVSAAIAYWDVDLRNRFANQRLLDWFGLRGGAARGRHAREILGEVVFAMSRAEMEAALRGEPQRFEREVTTPDGKTRHLAITYTPDLRDGLVLGFVATANDVSELRAAVVTSERRNALLSMAEEVAEIGHWRFEIGSDRLYWSPQVYRIHGLDPASFVPTLTNAVDAFHPDDRARVKEVIERAIERQENFVFELRLVRADGAVRRVESRGRCEIDPRTGATRATVGVFQDVTERDTARERSALQDRLVTTGTLAAGVGHEVNNPLTYVTANVEFALGELRELAGPLPSSRMTEVLEVLDEAREGADRIGRIVRGLKAFAREDAPRAATDVHAALEVAIDMAVHELKKGLTLIRDLGPVPPVRADAAQLSQVFVSLLVNAAQSFAVPDPAKNTIVARTRVLDDGRVAIEIEDNGSGIPGDVLPRIYDPFFTTKTVGQGSGLGLAIAHTIVTSLGGEISCATALGKGTSFRVAFAAAPEAVRPPPVDPPAATAARGRVLVVDDEPSVLRTIARALRSEHDVTTAESALEALGLLAEDQPPFDLIFCDLMMPVMSGMELYRRVEASDPSLAKRFVFVTGGSANDELRAFLQAVPNERLDKPSDTDGFKAIAARFARKT